MTHNAFQYNSDHNTTPTTAPISKALINTMNVKPIETQRGHDLSLIFILLKYNISSQQL